MATAREISIAIAGYGDPVPADPYRLRQYSTSTLAGTVVAARLLPVPPSAVAGQILVADCWARQSSLSWRAVGLDQEAAGEALLGFLFQSNPEPVAYLTTDLTVGAAVAVADLHDGQLWSATPFTFYVEREALVCTNVAGAGPHYTLTLAARGAFGTIAAPHSSGVGADRALFVGNPIVESREVTAYLLDVVADTETVWWRGLLEAPGGLSRGLLQMDLSARDLFSALADHELGVDRFQTEVTLEAEGFEGAEGRTVLRQAGFLPKRFNLLCRDANDFQRLPLACDSAVIAARLWETATGRSSFQRGELPAGTLSGYPSLLGSVSSSAEEASAREVLLADAGTSSRTSYSLVRDESGVRSDHPLDILLAVWTSSGTATWPAVGAHTVGSNGTQDWLPRHWGVGIPSGFVDVSGIEALRDSLQFRHLRASLFLAGHEEQPPTAKEVTISLLRPLFLFPAINATGQLTVVDPAPTGAVVATITRDSLASRVEVQPWCGFRRAARCVVRCARHGLGDGFGEILDDSLWSEIAQNRYPYGVSAISIDAGHYGDPDTGVLPELTRFKLELRSRLRWLFHHARLPEYRFDLHPDVARIPMGSLVEATLGVLVGADGARGSVDGHTCFVLDSGTDPETFCQQLRVVDLWPLTRASTLIAPSWRIDGVVNNTQFDIDTNDFTTDDLATIAALDRVELYDTTGARRSTDSQRTVTLVQVPTPNITIGAQWTTGGVPVVPAVGDIVRVPIYDDRGATWADYTWIADTAAQLGAANDPAHRWGL